MGSIWFWIIIFAVSYCIHEIRQRNHALDDDEPPESQNDINDYMSDYDKTSGNGYEGMDTVTFVQKLLEKLNCKYDSEDDDIIGRPSKI